LFELRNGKGVSKGVWCASSRILWVKGVWYIA
jgi:hypothetical protein